MFVCMNEKESDFACGHPKEVKERIWLITVVPES